VPVPLGLAESLLFKFLAAYIASFMTEGMAPIPCYLMGHCFIGFIFCDQSFCF